MSKMAEFQRFFPNSITITIMAALLLLLVSATATAEDRRVNKSASAALPYWSAASGENGGGDDILTWKMEEDEGLSQEEQDQIDGGFSSLDSMLQWAVGHSDPAKLKESAQNIQRLSPDELKKRQMEIKELMENLHMPSDAQLMKIAIDDLNNLSLPLDNRHRALEELLILVEHIDNANDWLKLGGLTTIIRELNNPNPEIRSKSVWILGKASQNNPVAQKEILELGTLAKLIDMARSDFIDEASKALYTISALIRNNPEGQDIFYMEAGDVMLQDILSNSSVDIRLRRKSVSLLADLIEYQLDRQNTDGPPVFSSHFFLKSVVDLVAAEDLDLQEKALYAIKNLLLLRSTDVLAFKEVCKLDVILERMRQQLQQLIIEDNFKDYAVDMESLRGEVERIFLATLEKVESVSS